MKQAYTYLRLDGEINLLDRRLPTAKISIHSLNISVLEHQRLALKWDSHHTQPQNGGIGRSTMCVLSFLRICPCVNG